MAQIFRKRSNLVPLLLAGGAVVGGAAAVAFVWYYFSPEFTDVGYRPAQPVAFSHRLHAGELAIDCRYCHSTVEVAAVASVPATKTCMNCHQLVKRDSALLEPVIASAADGTPIEWVRVHKVPEYAYFDHSVHLRAGVGCSSCHGDVAAMEVVTQVEPLSMGWCLACHRDPDDHLRPADLLTDTAWRPPSDQAAFAAEARERLALESLEDCTTCHR